MRNSAGVGACVLAWASLSSNLARAASCDLTVGPGGSYATIQEAVDAAGITHGDLRICVRAGTRHETFHIDSGLADGDVVDISGGWNAVFAARTGRTTLDASGVGPVASVNASHGTVALGHFTFATLGGRAAEAEEVALLRLSGGAEGIVEDNEFQSIALRHPEGAFGGPLTVWARDKANLVVQRNRFTGNVTSSPSDASETHAGAYLNGSVGAHLEVVDNLFQENEATAILDVQTFDSASGLVARNTAERNHVRSIAGGPTPAVLLLFAISGPSGAARISADRNLVIANSNSGPSDANDGQVFVFASGTGSVRLGDSVIARGASLSGVVAANDMALPGTLQATNLTIVDNAGTGFSGTGPAAGPVSLSNSIVSGHSLDVDGTPAETSNLEGTPSGLRFVDRAGGDYRLEFGSSGIDAGDADPPGGLSATDADGNPRVQCGRVDVGAYEAPCVTAGSTSPVCRALDVPLTLPFVSRDAPACRCLADPGLRELECGFFLPDVFLVLRWPLITSAGAPVPARWTIHPWTPVGGPFGFEMGAHLGDEWVPEERLGAGAQGLSDDRLVFQSFRLKVPEAGRTPMRAVLTYLRPGGKEPDRAGVEILMPEPTAGPIR